MISFWRGGPKYVDLETYDLKNMVPNGIALYKLCKPISKNIAYLLPRNVENVQIRSELLESGEECEAEYLYLNDRLKGVCFYFGSLVRTIELYANKEEKTIED